jgi:hypothetical protein
MLPPGSARPVRRSLLMPLVAGGALAVLAIGALAIGVLLRGRPAPAPAPSSGAAVSELTQELVRKQVQLARRELDGKNYAAAAAEAEGALKLAPAMPRRARCWRTRERVARSTARSRSAGSSTRGHRRRPGELSHLPSSTRATRPRRSLARLNSAFRAQADTATSSMRRPRRRPGRGSRQSRVGGRRREPAMLLSKASSRRDPRAPRGSGRP